MSTNNEELIPKALKRWFVVHFITDILFAVPLFLFPVRFLTLLDWSPIDPITSRMVAAALFGIGIESLLSRNSSIDSFKTMLSLKIIWSTAAIIGLGIALLSNLFSIAAVGISLLLTFVLFNILWVYWFIRLKKLQ